MPWSECAPDAAARPATPRAPEDLVRTPQLPGRPCRPAVAERQTGVATPREHRPRQAWWRKPTAGVVRPASRRRPMDQASAPPAPGHAGGRMRTTGSLGGTRATAARRRRQRVVHRDAGHRGQRVPTRPSILRDGNVGSRLPGAEGRPRRKPPDGSGHDDALLQPGTRCRRRPLGSAAVEPDIVPGASRRLAAAWALCRLSSGSCWGSQPGVSVFA